MSRDDVCRAFRSKVEMIARSTWRKKVRNDSLTVGDLVSCGHLGLLEAFDRYDEARGIHFAAFAEYRIRGAMFDALRANDPLSRRRRTLAKRLQRATKDATSKSQRSAEPEEIAAQIGMSLDQYWRARDRVRPVRFVALDEPGFSDDSDGLPLSERIEENTFGSPSRRVIDRQVRDQLKEAISELPERQRQCVLLYYGRDLSQAEIAAVFGVTVSRVSQILAAARQRLRKRLSGRIDPMDLGVFN